MAAQRATPPRIATVSPADPSRQSGPLLTLAQTPPQMIPAPQKPQMIPAAQMPPQMRQPPQMQPTMQPPQMHPSQMMQGSQAPAMQPAQPHAAAQPLMPPSEPTNLGAKALLDDPRFGWGEQAAPVAGPSMAATGANLEAGDAGAYKIRSNSKWIILAVFLIVTAGGAIAILAMQ